MIIIPNSSRNKARLDVGLVLTLSALTICMTVVVPVRLVSAQSVAPSLGKDTSLNSYPAGRASVRRPGQNVISFPSYQQNARSRATPSGIGPAQRTSGGGNLSAANNLELSSWNRTGNLNDERALHTATLLPNGKVLAAGGGDPLFFQFDNNTAELYDPSTAIWTRTGSLSSGRFYHTATLLPNGKVLVAGGYGGNCSFFGCSILSSAELYDPATGNWSSTGKLNSGHYAHTATLLPNGKVLVAGNGFAEDNVELYNPTTGTWSYTGSLDTPRFQHTATLLPSGKVLVAGGDHCNDSGCFTFDRCDLYDPTTGTWSTTGKLNVARYSHTATLLANGRVLVAGGFDPNGSPSNSAELYDPATGTWSSTGNLNTGRGFHTATLLLSGKVLIAGGYGDRELNSAELYDPATGIWSNIGDLNAARDSHTAVLLGDGKVLVAGGYNYDLDDFLNGAELYDPGVNSIDSAQFFVRQHYLDFLSRNPDAAGLAYWTNEITKCGSEVRCIHERRIGVSGAFFVEMEFQDTGYYVDRFYKVSFGRQPSYAEFTSDRGKVIGGSNLEANKQAFADEWVQRSAFGDAYPSTMSNTEFVNKLFDSAGLTNSIYDPQRQQEILAMNAGRSRALVLRDVIEIPDLKNPPNPSDPRYAEIKQVSQYNPAFVLMQYFGYLRRNVDQDGYAFWLDIVNNREPNNYHGMICSFITSSEYQLRFGTTVTRSNTDCGP